MSLERQLPTEAINEATRDLDTLEMPQLVALLAREQSVALEAVERAQGAIARAVDGSVARLRKMLSYIQLDAARGRGDAILFRDGR